MITCDVKNKGFVGKKYAIEDCMCEKIAKLYRWELKKSPYGLFFNWLETVDKIRTECRDELLEMKDAMINFLDSGT